MSSQRADAFYYVAQATIVGQYYYGDVKLDRAYRDFKAIEQEKSSIPLLEETIENKFKQLYAEIDRQRMEIEGEL